MSDNRLFKIVYHLLTKGQATAPELAEQFDVSVRTIYRDVDAISSAGIPIYVTTGRKGGIRLLDDFVLDKTLLTDAEKREILISLQSLPATRYPDMDTLLSKLGAVFQVGLTNWIDVDFSRWGSYGAKDNERFCQLQEAIFTKRIVRFCYYGADRDEEHREAEPLRLVYKDKTWYFYGFCLMRNDYRLFQLSRTKQLFVTNRTFVRSIDDNGLVFPQPEDIGPFVNLELEFSLTVGHRLYDVLDEMVIRRCDNCYRVGLVLPENEWLYEFLMSFGDKVTIVSPVEVRQKMAKRYRAALSHCKKKGRYE